MRGPMIAALGERFARFFRATTPDPFVLAVLLTFVTFGLGLLFSDLSPVALLEAWQGDAGFFSLLRFAMQMVLMLVTGHALASANVVRRGIARLADLPQTGAQGAALVALVAMSAALLNWGLGLIVGALLARDVGVSCRRRGIPAHYPLLVAAGYSGLLCWHGGLSGTAPLKMTTEADVTKFLGPELAAKVPPLAFTDTVLSPFNFLATGGLLLLVPALCYALSPKNEGAPCPAHLADETPPRSSSAQAGEALTIPERLERSRALGFLTVLPLLAASVLWLRAHGIAKLDPDALNLFFLTLGLLLHGSLRAYGTAIGNAAQGAAGIVLQFPFYAGIMGIMRASGMATAFASFLSSSVPASLFLTTTFASAGLINLFVPSGGGQWAIQGPIAMEAALRLGVDPALAVLSVAYGDQLTNMLQPFWALPLLAITEVRARDMIGYTAVLMLGGALWLGGCLWAAGLLG